MSLLNIVRSDPPRFVLSLIVLKLFILAIANGVKITCFAFIKLNPGLSVKELSELIKLLVADELLAHVSAPNNSLDRQICCKLNVRLIGKSLF